MSVIYMYTCSEAMKIAWIKQSDSDLHDSIQITFKMKNKEIR